MSGKADTEFQLTQFTTVDGLANNTVRHIMQDTKGRLWICTSNGLSRYDGKGFTNFNQQRDAKEESLHSRKVKRALEKNGLLWIAEGSGISCYDLHDEFFIDYKSKGLNAPKISTDYTDVQTITDKQGRIWKVTENDGLYIINNKTGETEHFTTTSKNNPLPTNALKCIFMDKEGTIWIGTDNLGLSQIKVLQNYGVKYILEGENIRLLKHIDKDRIAIGNRNGDVWIYDSKLSKELDHYKREKNTYCILKDKDGNIWEGTKGDGLYLNGQKKTDISFSDIYSLYQDDKGSIWIGTFGNGLYHNGKLFLDADYGSKRIRSLIADNKGNIWTATSNGVYIFQSTELEKNKKKYIHISEESGDLYSNEIRAMFQDSKGNFYIAETGVGFALLDGTQFYKDRSIHLTHFSEKDSLINTMIQSFAEDRNGFIWIATEFGISKFNPSTHAFKNYFFSKNMLNNVYSENCGIRLDDGRLAFGTNNGIIIISPKVYNNGETTTDIKAEDITVNGAPVKKGIIYVVSKWWKSPWAIMVYILVIAVIAVIWRRVKRNNTRFHKTIKELNIKKDKLVQEKEEIREHYTTEVKIRREADKSANDQEFISRIEAIANNELSNSTFSADDFAGQMGMGRTVFFNKMKSITGYSPKEYMKLKRIKRAAELISTTGMPISEIAFTVGIDDPLYFSRVFKQQFGMPPTEWRNHSTNA